MATKKGGFPIKISLRCRPRNKKETDAKSPNIVKCNQDEATCDLQIKTAGKIDSKTYTYDNVFGPDSTQLEVYEAVVAPSLCEVMEGYNCTVFAYGQTGTGKTHTMEGKRANEVFDSYKDDPNAGLIPRTMMHLFEKLEAGPASEYTVRVSFLEIYNEEIFDLLGDEPLDPSTSQRLRLFEDNNRKGSVIIQGLEEITINDKADVYKVLQKGADKRRTAETNMNKASSRSHSVFSVTVHQKENNMEGEETLKIGKLYLVDLAGSENVGRSGAVNARAREAGNINQSLLTLGRVISKLVERAGHIPYRESKLTRLLQDSLGGRTKTSIIATVSPAAVNMEESQSTMEYATRAKNIINKPELNQKVSKRMVIKEYTNEIERLKRDLMAAREKDGVFLTAERYATMNTEAAFNTEQIEELEGQIKASTEELAKITASFEKTSVELEETSAKLAETAQTLDTVTTEYLETAEALEVQVVKTEETEFLLDTRATTETALHREATKVIEVADVTTAHIDKLHEKVMRKSAVEQHNAGSRSQFADMIASECTGIHGSILSFATGQAESIEGIRTSMQAFMAQTQTRLTELGAKVDALSGDVDRDVGSQRSALTSAQDAVVESTAAAKADVDRMVAENTEFAQNAFGAEVRAAVGELKGSLSEQMTAAGEYAGSIEQQCEAANARLDAFASANSGAIAGLQQSVQVHLADQNTRLADRSAQVAGVVDAHTGSAEASMAEVQTRVNTILADFMAAQATSLRGAVESVYSEISATQIANTEFSAGFDANVAGISRRAGSFVVKETDAIASQYADATITKVASGAGFSTLQERSSGIETRLVGSGEAMVTRMVAWGASSTAAFDQIATTAARHTGAIIETMELNAERSTMQCAEISEGVEGEGVSITQQTGTVGDKLVASAAAITAHGKVTSGRVDQASAIFQTHLQKEFKQDVPTGDTPQRQAYTYPKDLPTTRPHDELLAGFRAQKAVNPSPTDDFATPTRPDAPPAIESTKVGEPSAPKMEAIMPIEQGSNENAVKAPAAKTGAPMAKPSSLGRTGQIARSLPQRPALGAVNAK